jgi:hypothetical protein
MESLGVDRVNKDKFLPQDTHTAITEYRAAWTCISRIEECLMKGDLQEAKLTIRDLSKSIIELERLAERKQNHDRFIQVINDLNSKGILVEKWIMQSKL